MIMKDSLACVTLRAEMIECVSNSTRSGGAITCA